jgi:HEAT repeat protein
VLGLASCTDVRREAILRTLVDLLVDPAHTVRLETARALAQLGGDEAELLLRLKARAGDEDSQVVGQVFDCVLAVEGESGVEFVAVFLDSAKPEVREEAALSLGSSRFPKAVARLQSVWKSNHDPDLRLAVLRALSASRLDDAIEFLLDIVRTGRARDKVDALEALRIHKDSEEIWKRVQQAQIQPQSADGA